MNWNKIFAFLIRYVYAVANCLYVFTIGMFFPGGRYRLYRLCGAFNFYKTSNKPLIPRVNLSELILEDLPILIPRPFAKEGNIATVEQVTAAKLIQLKKPINLFEFGTFDGLTTLILAANCSADSKVYTLDLPKDKLGSVKLPLSQGDPHYINKDNIGVQYKGTQYEKKIVQLSEDSAQFDFSKYYNAIDFVLVDGSHSYDYVLNDSLIAIKLLKDSKGVILWHDYDSELWSGVTKALNKLYKENEQFKNLRHIDGTSFVCLIN